MADEEEDESPVRIIQLMAAPAGMYAVYNKGDGTYSKVRVLCFALCEHEGHTYIEPQAFEPVMGIEHGCPDCADDLMGYYLEGEEPSLEVYAEQAREMAKIAAKAEKEAVN